MCHFHSVIVTNDGRILHRATNSHSDIAEHFNLPCDDLTNMFWFECEWDGKGDMPVNLVQSRGRTVPPTMLALRMAEAHYAKLAVIVKGDLDPMFCEPFDGPQYADVQSAYEVAQAIKAIAPMVEALGELSVRAAREQIRLIVDDLNLDMCEIAQPEIENAIENDESRYNAGYSAGIEAASEDTYSQEYVDEQVEEARTKEREKIGEETESAYCEGYVAGRLGKPCEHSDSLPEYIDGVPSFLILPAVQ